MASGETLRRSGGVGWPGLLLVLVLLMTAAAAAGAGAAYWVVLRYTLHMPVQGQTLRVQLPDDLPVEVEIVPQALDESAGIPLQEIPVRIDERFRTTVRVDTQVPVRINVPFRGEVPVDITLPVNTRVRTRVLGVNLELPIEGEIPLRFSLPVDLTIPIDQTLPMKFDLPVSTRINQVVNVQVQTRQTAHIRLREPLLEVTVSEGEFAVPLSWLSLVGPVDDGEPSRLGPLVHPPARP